MGGCRPALLSLGTKSEQSMAEGGRGTSSCIFSCKLGTSRETGRKPLLSTKRQGSLRSSQAFNPSITSGGLRGAGARRHPILQHCPLRAEGHRASGAAQHSPVPPTGQKSAAAQLAKLPGPPSAPAAKQEGMLAENRV